MKKMIFLMTACCCFLQLQLVSAQSAELQQLILNVEKLAQLKSILKDMEAGYQIVSKGYGAIKDISEGNFSLHRQFLDGLMLVNPKLAKYRRVADIISFQKQLITEYKSAFGRFRSGGRFSVAELDYMSRVYDNLLERSLRQLDEMAMVITSGELRMSDEERIVAINRIYDDMQGKVSFLRSFNRRTSAVDSRRKADAAAFELMKKVNGTNKP